MKEVMIFNMGNMQLSSFGINLHPYRAYGFSYENNIILFIKCIANNEFPRKQQPSSV